MVPPDRLKNIKIYTLKAMVERYERGKKPPKMPSTKEAVVERLVQAGYSVDVEEKYVVTKRREDELAAVKRERERAAGEPFTMNVRTATVLFTMLCGSSS